MENCKKFKKTAYSLIFLATMLLGFLCLSPHAKSATRPKGEFGIEFIDVGQGDAALVWCDGHYMMIDGGPSEASSVIYSILKKNEIAKLDYMIATHPDADHIGGLSGALNYASVGTCYSPVLTNDTKTFRDLEKYLKKQGVKMKVPAAGTTFVLGSAKVELLGPVSVNAEMNNNSIVTKITYGTTSFLFMGDAEFDEENSLIDAKKILPVML